MAETFGPMIALGATLLLATPAFARANPAAAPPAAAPPTAAPPTAIASETTPPLTENPTPTGHYTGPDGVTRPLDRLPALSATWTADLAWGGARLETPTGPAFAGVAPDGALVLIDARTGTTRGRLPPAESTRWDPFFPDREAGSTLLLLRERGPDGAIRLVRVDLPDGRIRWRTPPLEHTGVEVAHGFPVLTDDPRCLRQVLDPATGDPLGPSVRLGRVHYYRRLGEPHGPDVCRSDAWVKAGADGVAVVQYEDLEARRTVLAGFTAGGRTAWSLPLEHGGVLGLPRAGRPPVFVEFAGEPNRERALWSIDPATGRILWRQALRADEGCTSSTRRGQSRRLSGPVGHPDAILVPGCPMTVMIDAATGEPLWRRATDGVPVLTGEAGSSHLLLSMDPGAPVQWIRPDGTPGDRLAVPAGDEPLYLGPDGLLVRRADRGLAWIDANGTVRLEYRGPVSRWAVGGDTLAIATELEVVLIERSSGRAYRFRPEGGLGSGSLEGAFVGGGPGQPPLWVLPRRSPDGLIGVGLPLEPKSR